MQQRHNRGADFPKSRLEASKFSPQQIKNAQWMDIGDKIKLDQRTIGSLLAPLMSHESTRTLIELLGESGLLTREDVGHVMVGSPGHLERFYLKYIRQAAKANARSEQLAV